MTSRRRGQQPAGDAQADGRRRGGRRDGDGSAGHGAGTGVRRAGGQERADQAVDRPLVLREVLGHAPMHPGRQAARLRQHRAGARRSSSRCSSRRVSTCAIGTIDMAPDPPFVKGFNNPKYRDQVLKATRDAIDACAEHGFKNVICFTGMREGIPDDVGAANCVEGFKQIVGHAEKKGVTLCLEMLNSRGQHAPDEGPPRLPGGPHRVLRRHHQAGRLAAPEAAVRHLPRPDHGRRRDPPAPRAPGRTSATSTPPATPAAASSTTSRRSTTSRSWRR